MNGRIKRLRERSLAAIPTISAQRAKLLTEFYRETEGKYSIPVLRAMAFKHLCERKAVWIGTDELIVGERGPEPAATPTFPELNCHSVEDLQILDSREKTRYRVAAETIADYQHEIIPYWKGRSLRDRAFAQLAAEWHAAYEAGVFTEFMEQRAPGHTVADGKIYRKGLRDFQQDISIALDRLDFEADPDAAARAEQLKSMHVAAEGAIIFAARHAAAALEMANRETDPVRARELRRIASNCARVPAHAPRDYWEALQAYWFYHLGVITELNGWDAFNPGHLDRHLQPFYAADMAAGRIDRATAKELLQCFWIKFNNHPAPPKVGVTAAESGTYTDFANINIGGIERDGSDAVSEVSYLLLEVIDEMHTLQPSNNIQLSRKNPDRFLMEAARVVRKGYGFPSLFNADMVVAELVRQGKSLEDARDGGTSGCVEAGAFGKEAYILTGYFNLVKILELALHDGCDPRTGKQLGPRTGDPRRFATFDQVMDAWRSQLRHFVDIKCAGNVVFERMFAREMPAPFLSIIIDDCIEKGQDYNAGGARYNTSYIQGVGIGSLSDSLAALRQVVFDDETVSMTDMLAALDDDFTGREALRQSLVTHGPKYGNDNDYADNIMVECFDGFFAAVDGRPNVRSGEYHIDMLPTTCHIYFGAVTGATPDGRRAGAPLSEGISPVQGADRRGPTAVMKSVGKMDHRKTGGTLLNMKLNPQLLETEEDLEKFANLVRAHFSLGSHHIQFNVITAATLREAQAEPQQHRDLIVRVAGYSDYFCDLSQELQDEIISRTEQVPAG